MGSRSEAEELTGSKACDGDEEEGILKKKWENKCSKIVSAKCLS